MDWISPSTLFVIESNYEKASLGILSLVWCSRPSCCPFEAAPGFKSGTSTTNRLHTSIGILVIGLSITTLVHLLVAEGRGKNVLYDWIIFSVSVLGASPLPLSSKPQAVHSSEKTAIAIELLSAHLSAM